MSIVTKKQTRRASRPPAKPNQATADFLTGVGEVQAMLKSGKRPEDVFTVKTVTVAAPAMYSPADVRKLREQLAASQGLFAQMLGVSRILAQSWERGVREPSPLARRLMDTISLDPRKFIATLHGPSSRKLVQTTVGVRK